MPISPLPTPPSRDDPADFAARADTFLQSIPTFAVQANALEMNVNNQAATVSGKVDTFTALLASTGLTQFGSPPNTLILTRNSDDASGPSLVLRKARGSDSSPTNAVANDVAGGLRFQAQVGGSTVDIGRIEATYLDTGAGRGARLTLSVPPLGGTVRQDVLRLEADTGLSMFGANVVVDQNRLLRLRSYTVATLPAANLSPLGMAWASDIGGTSAGLGLVISDGARWLRVGRNYSSASTYDQDADVALPASFLLCPTTIRHSSTLTANRLLTLPTTGVGVGDRLRVTRTGGGASTLSVGGLKTLATGTWCDVEWSGASWVLTAYGNL